MPKPISAGNVVNVLPACSQLDCFLALSLSRAGIPPVGTNVSPVYGANSDVSNPSIISVSLLATGPSSIRVLFLGASLGRLVIGSSSLDEPSSIRVLF